MPGALIHLNIKKLGRIDGIGHRFMSLSTTPADWPTARFCPVNASNVPSLCFGISVERIMTDNGSAYNTIPY